MSATDFTSAGRVVMLLDPDEHAAGATPAGIELDTLGWRFLHVTVMTGTVAATADGTINVQAATSSGGSFSTISGATFTVAATDDDTVLHGVIDLEQQARYIKLDTTTGTGGASDIAVVGVLYGCANTAEYINAGSGEADELTFRVLS